MISFLALFVFLSILHDNVFAGANDRPETSEEVKKLVNEAYEIFNNNPQAGIRKIEEIRAFCISKKDSAGIFSTYYNQGIFYY